MMKIVGLNGSHGSVRVEGVKQKGVMRICATVGCRIYVEDIAYGDTSSCRRCMSDLYLLVQ